jgi:hypothetical protein
MAKAQFLHAQLHANPVHFFPQQCFGVEGSFFPKKLDMSTFFV